jgi:hypothetical protein
MLVAALLKIGGLTMLAQIPLPLARQLVRQDHQLAVSPQPRPSDCPCRARVRLVHVQVEGRLRAAVLGRNPIGLGRESTRAR